MDDRRTHRCGSTRTPRGRLALTFQLAVALALGVAACADTAAGPPSRDPGSGKADSEQQRNADLVSSMMQALPERPGMVDVARNPAHQWFARLIGPGGEIYLASGRYQQEPSAINAILGIKESGVLPERYRVVPGADGACSVELRAANQQVIATGPAFGSCEEATAAIQATRDLVAGVVQFEAAVSAGARFDLWRDPADGKWYFALRAADRRVLCESQAYARRMDAINGIASVRTNGKLPARYRLIKQADDSVSISLRAANGREIGQSGPYPTAEQAQAAVDESIDLLRSERVGNPW